MRIVLALALVSSVAFAGKTPPVIARVMRIEIVGASTILTAASGSEQGIEKRSTCALLGKDGAKVTDSCVLVRVDRRATVVKTDVTFDQVRGDLRVKFSIPDPE